MNASYKQLQKLAKNHGIRANQSKEILEKVLQPYIKSNEVHSDEFKEDEISKEESKHVAQDIITPFNVPLISETETATSNVSTQLAGSDATDMVKPELIQAVAHAISQESKEFSNCNTTDVEGMETSSTGDELNSILSNSFKKSTDESLYFSMANMMIYPSSNLEVLITASRMVEAAAVNELSFNKTAPENISSINQKAILVFNASLSSRTTRARQRLTAHA